MTTSVQTVSIVVYTTRIGIGFSGQATNCSPKLREAFDIAVIDQETNPARVVKAVKDLVCFMHYFERPYVWRETEHGDA